MCVYLFMYVSIVKRISTTIFNHVCAIISSTFQQFHDSFLSKAGIFLGNEYVQVGFCKLQGYLVNIEMIGNAKLQTQLSTMCIIVHAR